MTHHGGDPPYSPTVDDAAPQEDDGEGGLVPTDVAMQAYCMSSAAYDEVEGAVNDPVCAV